MIEWLGLGSPYLPKAGALPGCATPRTVAGQWLIGNFRGALQERKTADLGLFCHQTTPKTPPVFGVSALFLAAALAFDPHVLMLSWSAERQETVAATSRMTCEAARDAIAAGRWLADDPPAAMRCERGAAFAPGWDCIEGYSCPRHAK